MKRQLTVIGTVAALAVAGSGVAATAAPAGLDGLSLVKTKHSLLGTHTWYQQTWHGIPVLGGYYATHTNDKTGETTVADGRLTVTGSPSVTATFARGKAESAVTGRLSGSLVRNASPVIEVENGTAKLGWLVLTQTAKGTVQSVVDAKTGSTLTEESTVKNVDGTGVVFDPNPVVTLQNESLTDSSNANSSTFTNAYKTVTLTQLTSGVTTLRGAYAYNTSTSGVTSSTRTYSYNRSQAGFEQTEAYYQITKAQEYIQSLGFTDVNASAQKFKTTGYTDDNSYYDPSTDAITFGTGGVDDAEDAEIIWHEYGHAIQDDQVAGFGSSDEAGAIGEGFGDYWAYSLSSAVSSNTTVTPLACIGDWDAVSYTSSTPHCLRRVDGTKTYPSDVEDEVHADGEIWSRALYDINTALGRTVADTIILEAQFNYTAGTNFAAAANATVAAATSLYGSTTAATVKAKFQARGFI
ncbi:M4 family metallopeptidase [Actinoplanes sp. NPDC051851]|uniref:M4 family metallopeptidase n=1 Tax=Actinoplanes sp. NPDC051851 TaxID=3154753 RepID=UPI0034331437